MARKKSTNGKMTLERAVTILLQEIADVRLELKGDIASSHTSLSARMDRLEVRVDSLDNKVDHNYLTFMAYLKDIDGRVRVLEAAK